MNTTNLFKQLALASAVGLATSQASAALIGSWDFSVTGEWVTGDTVFTSGGGFQENTASRLSWGSEIGDTDPFLNSSRSGLVIDSSPVTGTISTDGAAEDTILITHVNNAISAAFATLDSATFRTTLTLTPQPAGAPDFGPVVQSIPINFIETSNSSPCGFDSDTVCDDIFQFTVPESLSFDFEFDGALYTTTIGAPGLGPLGDACGVVGVGDGCVGLQTDEASSNPVQFNFRVTGRELPPPPVPVPATLALFGAGLLGLSGLARRRKNQG